MVQISKKLTLAQFLLLPETKPASEYIEGEISQKSMPQGEHSAIQGELTSRLNALLKKQKIAWALPELRCTFGGQSIVPDIAMFIWTLIPHQENGTIANIFTTPPDWTIEILSPKQSLTKVTKNILHSLKQGTQMAWLIDPSERSIVASYPTLETEVFAQPEQFLPVPLFANQFKLTVADIFSILTFDL